MKHWVRKTQRLIVILSLLLGIWIPFRQVEAQEKNIITMTVKAGLDGYCRIGSWIPVRVSVDNQGAALEGQLQVEQKPTGSSQSVYIQEINLTGLSSHEWTIYLYPENYLEAVNVSLTSGGQTIQSLSTNVICLQSGDLLFGIIDDDPTTFLTLNNQSQTNGKVYLARLTAEDIPVQADALSVMDSLIISNTDSGLFSQKQLNSISAWVSSGGQLMITGGPGWERTTAGLDPLLPVQIQGVQSVENLDVLARAIGQNDPLKGNTLVTQGSLYKTGTQKTIVQGDIPLVLERSVGIGKVIYLTFDPNLEPFSGWDKKKDFLEKLTGGESRRPVWAWGFQNWDIIHQISSQFPNQMPFELPVLVTGLFLYVLTIVIITFVTLKRSKRAGLNWITIPSLVLICTAGIMLYSHYGMGAKNIINRLAIVQVFPEDKQAHLTGAIGFYSSKRDGLNLQLIQDLLLHTIPKRQNLSENTKEGTKSYIQQPGIGPLVKNLTILNQSPWTAGVEGQIPAPDIHADLSIQTGGDKSTILGVITNNSDLTLEDAALLTPIGRQMIGVIPARSNQSVQFTIDGNTIQAKQSGYTRKEISSISDPVYSLLNDSILISDGKKNTQNQISSQQREGLISALMKDQKRGDGKKDKVFLAGWSLSSPIEIKEMDSGLKGSSNTLYLIQLNLKTGYQADPAEI